MTHATRHNSVTKQHHNMRDRRCENMLVCQRRSFKQRPYPFVYLSIFWTDFGVSGGDKNLIDNYLTTLPKNITYFTVVQCDRGVGPTQPGPCRYHFPVGLRIVGFLAGGSSDSNSNTFVERIPIPLLLRELPDMPKINRDLGVVFQGSYTHSVRTKLQELFSQQFKFMSPSSDWARIIQRSNFTLCPRGFGETSFRLAEVIRLGSIPIYVWQGQKWLPYQELIEWDMFAIVLPAEYIENLPQLVSIAESRLELMQQALKRVSHMFTYNFTSDYILRRMYHLQGLIPH